MPEISVTMSAFNVAPFVSDCLDSILAQEFSDFELIIVDDASTDGTRVILEDYASRDSRIQLFTNDTNKGLAVARNLGIIKAQADWITFLDADDVYDPKMLSLAMKAAREQDVDLVIWDYVIFSNSDEIDEKIQIPSMLSEIDPKNKDALLGLPAFAWTRLVRREIFLQHQIAFPPGLTYQDVLVHWHLITQLKHIALIPSRLAYYRQQPSATTASKGMKRVDYFYVLDLVEDYLRAHELFDIYSDTLTALQLNAWYGVHDIISTCHQPTVKALISERLSDRHRSYFNSTEPMRWQAREFFRAFDGDLAAKVKFQLWVTTRKLYRSLRSKL